MRKIDSYGNRFRGQGTFNEMLLAFRERYPNGYLRFIFSPQAERPWRVLDQRGCAGTGSDGRNAFENYFDTWTEEL